ncbi:polysaccharide deacetylase family protein [Streptomyces sp. PTY087I2]|uniref:polysaccharide deacetylase family protein n=1 Tax=Streptomyces sp. PTY087I2 TaxID=1819298 RepID=UPI00080B5FC7|nr:polysaccharide deacetylase family protein [Streptomyces sp. PTY087I2]OCC08570.1 Peptidoglycan-N-acetylglucosamine deacetylase [Streptomyces sp. PTY087I2]
MAAIVLALAWTAAFSFPGGRAPGHLRSETAAARGGPSGEDVSLPRPVVDMAIVRESEDPGKTVNITLDDGPSPRWTPKALELLRQYKAKATFCVTGPNAAAHPDLIRRIVAEGHRLCDHSISHDSTMDHKPVAYQEKEILDAKRMIDKASGGARLWYYRAPGGAFTPQSRQIAAAHGMRNLGWNVDPSDYEQPGTNRIIRAVQQQIEKGPTVLLHDGGGNRAQSMEALGRLLPWFTERGYTFSFPEAG